MIVKFAYILPSIDSGISQEMLLQTSSTNDPNSHAQRKREIGKYGVSLIVIGIQIQLRD